MKRPSEMIRLGVVQPRDYWGDESPRMLQDALAYIEDAGRREVGADRPIRGRSGD